MVKQGMARPEWTHTQPRNDLPPVPELQGKAKKTKQSKPIVEDAPHSIRSKNPQTIWFQGDFLLMCRKIAREIVCELTGGLSSKRIGFYQA